MISVITVNYKTADYLERMLTSLFLYHSKDAVEVMVIENASGDDLSKLKTTFPSVRFLESDRNLGFAGGCNLGLPYATGAFIVLVNPDILFTQPALYSIQKAMEADPKIGIGGISLKNLDGTQQACVWNFPRPVDQLCVLLKLHHLFPRLPAMNRWRQEQFDYSKDADVEQVMGAFFCIRREVIEKIGPLDDGFFIWYEEVDYCRRAVNAGFLVHYFADISARHKKGSSFDRVETRQKQDILRKSIRRYIKKHFGFGVFLLFFFLEPVFILMSLLTSLLKKSS